MWSKAIIDRTVEDVEYADLNRGSVEELKGMRDYRFLNRVGLNMRELVKRFGMLRKVYQFYSPAPPMLTSKVDWVLEDFPVRSEIQKIENDVEGMRSMGIIGYDTPSAPGLPYTHFEKLNSVERIIYDIYVIQEGIIVSPKVCGTFYAGEGDSLD